MRTKTLSAALISTLLTLPASSVLADEAGKKNKREAIATGKGAVLFSSGVIAGAAVGGPLGAFIGAMGGALIGEDLQKGAQDANALEDSEQQLAEFKLELQENEAKIATLQEATAQRLEFQVLFTSGSDKLNHGDTQRLISLANYLNRNPELKVRLEGYADPRGSEENNEELSEDRAKAVVSSLEAQGISSDRISYTAYGAELSTAVPGDYEAYALERRVNIEVFNEQATTVAAH